MRRTRSILIGLALLIAAVVGDKLFTAARARTVPSSPFQQASLPVTGSVAAVLPSSHAGIPWHKPVKTDGPRIQVAILLDTSGSMDGLINQTRKQLWEIVDTLSQAKQDGHTPGIELALYAYGTAADAESGYMHQVAPFTDELDGVSQELFALTTTGSEEYCGQVIQTATRELEWSTNPNDLKLIFIAGNEPFTQGTVNPTTAIREAAAKGIIVNTIHCGPERDGIAGGWRDAAQAANGRFMVINQDQAVAEIAAPQDAELAALGQELNKTYVPYGEYGTAGAARQTAQDSNSWGISIINSSRRAVAKSTASYRNDNWDLVDAVQSKTVSLGALPNGALPAELQSKSTDEREGWIKQKQADRERVQARIRTLEEQRRQFLADAHRSNAGATTLDQAMIAAVREQAARVHFALK